MKPSREQVQKAIDAKPEVDYLPTTITADQIRFLLSEWVNGSTPRSREWLEKSATATNSDVETRYNMGLDFIRFIEWIQKGR